MHWKQICLWYDPIQSVSPDWATAELSVVHPWHCPPDHPLHSDTSSYFTSSTRANLSSWSWQTTHLCVNGLSEEWGKWRRDNTESGRGAEGGNMVAKRIRIAQSARLFKGHILFEGPHPTLRSTSLYPSCLLPHNTLSANPLGNWTVHCLGLSYYSPYTAGVIWKSIKELKEWIENVDLQRFMLPYKTRALQPKKGQDGDKRLLDVETFFLRIYLFFVYDIMSADWCHCVRQRGRAEQTFQWWADRWKYGRTIDGETHTYTRVSRVHVCMFIFIRYLCVVVHTCMHTCPDSRCAHTRVLMCVFKQAYLFTFALQNPLTFEMQETGHIFLLCEPLDSSVRIF